MSSSNPSSHAGSTGGESSTPQRANRGFAAMDPGRQREIASEGGRAAHVRGTAHEFTSQEAREAGRKGGLARAESKGLRAKPAAQSSAQGDSASSSGGGDRVDSALRGEPGIER